MSEFRTAVHEGVGAAPVSGRHPLSGSSPASSSGVLTARCGGLALAVTPAGGTPLPACRQSSGAGIDPRQEAPAQLSATPGSAATPTKEAADVRSACG
mgnify:CR=1 FL=1